RGGLRPGRSSADGAIPELPLLRDTSRCRRSTLRRSSSIASAWAAITASRAAHEPQSGAGGGRPVTSNHDQSRPNVSKPTRWAGSGKITRQPASHAKSSKPSQSGGGDVNVYVLGAADHDLETDAGEAERGGGPN